MSGTATEDFQKSLVTLSNFCKKSGTVGEDSKKSPVKLPNIS